MVPDMSTRLLSMTAFLAGAWATLYTAGLADPVRQTRRREIASDVWECCAEVGCGERRSGAAAAEILVRLFLGIPDDILWRWEYQMNTSTNGPVPWWLNATGLGVSLSALGLYFAASLSALTSGSSLSIAIRDSVWIFPTILTVHVIAICAFVGFAAMVDLRVLGWTLRRTPVMDVGQSLLPWVTGGLAVVIISGAFIYMSDPMRYAGNSYFDVKIGMLLVGGLNAWACHRRVYQRATEWDQAGHVPARTRIASGFSLALWALIIVAGRLIAFGA